MFHVGQLVVCINDRMNNGHPHIAAFSYPTHGIIYIVRDYDAVWHTYPLLWLEEITNPAVCEGREPGFDASHFRRLTDERLSIFRKMLTDIPAKEDA